jgi:hypothetical protein
LYPKPATGPPKAADYAARIAGQPPSSQPDNVAPPVDSPVEHPPAEAATTDEPSGPLTGTDGAQWDPTRLACHLAIIAAFGIALIRALESGWAAVSDDAVISIRSFEVFSHNTPLVGQFTQLSTVFDLGPLQYWLLAVPVRLDPSHGALWGSTIWCVLAAAVAVEAMRAAGGRAAGVAAAVVIVWAVWWMPGIAVNPVWNPYLGDVFFLTTIAASYAALCGCRRYWPIAVFAGSVATQCHLMFALGSVVLVLLSGAVVAGRAVRAKAFPSALLVGVLVGIGCWIAPVIQQFTTSPGNLTELFSSQGQGARLGVSFGLRALGASTFPRPIFTELGGSLRLTADLRSGSAVIGVLTIVLVASVAALAWSAHKRPLFYLALVSLVTSLGLVATMANVLAAKDISLGYIVALSVPTGVLGWVTVVWGAAAGVEQLARRRAGADVPAHARPRRLPIPTGLAARWVGVGALVLVSVLLQIRQSGYEDNVENHLAVTLSSRAATKIEALVQSGTVNLLISEGPNLRNPLLEYDVVLGVAWRLRQDGLKPLVPMPAALVFGPRYQPYAVVLGAPSVSVKLGPASVTVRSVRF